MKLTLKAIFLSFALGSFFWGACIAGDYPVKPTEEYVTKANNPEIANECLPEYEWPEFGQPCTQNVTKTTLETNDETDLTPSESGCSDHAKCDGDCQTSTVYSNCTKDPETGEDIDCKEQTTTVSCACTPKCERLPDYPNCESVADKPGYDCIVTCTLCNGDTVDIKKKGTYCQNDKFEGCCYAQDNAGKLYTKDTTGLGSYPIETELGDPRDFCKLKCNDFCNDLYVVRRDPQPAPFGQCCTPPTPLKIACFCCRTLANYNSPQCDYFKRFFKCKESLPLECNDASTPAYNAPVCNPEGSVTPYPDKYDERYDPYVEFDPRFDYCGTPSSNLNCQYICRGEGVILPSQAPDSGMWSPNFSPPYNETYENNNIKYVQGNCARPTGSDWSEDKAVEWPPLPEGKETCAGQ